MLVSDIGRFYMAIDHKLRLKDCRADNVYRFIERMSHSSRAGDVLSIKLIIVIDRIVYGGAWYSYQNHRCVTTPICGC